MKILVVGGGGREHAIVKKLHESKYAPELYCAPGNGGIAEIATCLPVKATDVAGIVNIAVEKKIDLVFVAPDDPLMLGTVDALEEKGIRAFGPRQCAAIIEGSKVFSKELMKKYGIPTAGYEVFDSAEKALEYIKAQNEYPAVIKADGLALGKGVIIAKDYTEAEDAVKTIMCDKVFGESGSRVVIEEFLTGPEVSVLAFTDGKTIVPMVSAQDHKRALDNDMGLNTGGMGAFSPSRNYTPDIANECYNTIFKPTMDAMNKEGRTFKGVIYFGLMLTPKGPRVIEYNARFGDPETQAVLPRLKTDFVDIINAVIDEKLDEIEIEWKDDAAVCIVLASGGYPSKYESGKLIEGLDSEVFKSDDLFVYHAGTKAVDGKIYTAGGRVLGVTATGKTLDDAIAKSYSALKNISFEKMHYRNDIGRK
ncbi:MAG: phosphoribosylamine--glycine ligase [Ruminococcaceae bacterium]|nr:phosphoribosylamine--glycine ligase [Oscillospiraceae bacterium]